MFYRSFACDFNKLGYITSELTHNNLDVYDFNLFDHNGYDLTRAEIKYCENAKLEVSSHRHNGHVALKKLWFIDKSAATIYGAGAHINHAAIFERKGYKEWALFQLREFAQQHPIAYKVINIKPKWGVDLSIDYVDFDGNTFEVLHFEYDVFNYEEAAKVKEKVEEIVLATDWNDAAKALLAKKDEWISLDFFAMSEYKCKYFGLPAEKFKETIWHGN